MAGDLKWKSIITKCSGKVVSHHQVSFHHRGLKCKAWLWVHASLARHYGMCPAEVIYAEYWRAMLDLYHALPPHRNALITCIVPSYGSKMWDHAMHCGILQCIVGCGQQMWFRHLFHAEYLFRLCSLSDVLPSHRNVVITCIVSSYGNKNEGKYTS